MYIFLANISSMKGSIFWDITRCSPLNFNQLFRGTSTFNGLHGDIFQKLELSITTAVRTSDRKAFSLVFPLNINYMYSKFSLMFSYWFE
jgi:hypothetical protein